MAESDYRKQFASFEARYYAAMDKVEEAKVEEDKLARKMYAIWYSRP